MVLYFIMLSLALASTPFDFMSKVKIRVATKLPLSKSHFTGFLKDKEDFAVTTVLEQT